jgi:predicted nucleic acid-binding protein
LIFLDTNVISETLRKRPNPAVIAWLVRNDAELALPTVSIAEIAFGIGKIRPDARAHAWSKASLPGAIVLPTGSSPSPKPPRSPTATS